MKKKFKFLGFALLAIAIIFSMSACDDSGGGSGGGDSIASIYRGGPFSGSFTTPNIPSGSFTIGENSITGSGLNITNVTTKNGGTAQYNIEGTNVPITWAFLYEGSNKIGIAVCFTTMGNYQSYVFGKYYINIPEGFRAGWVGTAPETADMTDTYSGDINK